MTEPLRGTLVWQSSRKGKDTVKVRRVVYPTRKGLSPPTPFPDTQLAPALQAVSEDVEVDLELEGGKPVRIRPAGEPWTASAAPPPPPRPQATSGRPGTGQGRGPAAAGRAQAGHTPRRPASGFHNPYNFIPAVEPLAGRPDRIAQGLEQGAPAGHDRYHADRWSGRIEIALETVTPLLIPDAARAEEQANGHKVFDLRTDADGRPCLPPTSLKGALRAAYEAVTNSRLAVFQGHDVPLAHRMDARSGLGMIPARVTDDGKGLELWLGTSTPAPGTDRPQGPMYAAWLPRYRKGTGGVAPFAVRYPDRELPKHGEAVACWLQLFRHTRRNFTYWRVVAIARAGEKAPPEPQRLDRGFGAHEPVPGEPLILARGHVCITNQNINSKHDERVFFIPDKAKPEVVPLAPERLKELRTDWKNLIKNYQDLHADDLKKRDRANKPYDAYLGGEPGKTAWSRHVYTREDRELRPGTLCYARRDPATGEVLALYPVMISRELADCAPKALLPESLKPATLVKPQRDGERREPDAHARRFSRLSPADRVFGWASQKGDGAWRGQLRVGPIRCETGPDAAIHRFPQDNPLPLAILSTAKPQQARFYIARDQTGEPQPDHIRKDDAAYREGKGLRGRKVFPHPAHLGRAPEVAEAYWDPEAAVADSRPDATPVPRPAGSPLHREYRRRGNVRDDQNRSIRAWVTPGTRFTAWIDVINLNKAELGALLWLLSLGTDPDVGDTGAVHRLGGGKPLGFGSVRISLTGLDLANGHGKAAEYGSLFPVDPAAAAGDMVRATDAATAADAGTRFIDAFKTAVQEGYRTPTFTAVPFIAAFLTAARGFPDDLPVHYPRPSPAPDPEGRNYEWFVANDRTGRDAPPGNQVALGPLADDTGLPYWPEQQPALRGR